MFGIDYTVFRPHNVYGEHQNIGDRYRNVVGIFMNQMMQQKPLSVFGDGLQSRAFSYIDDVAPVIARSVAVREAANEVFNVGADQPTTVLDLAHLVGRAFGVAPEIVHLAPRNEVVHAYASHDKCRDVFGHANAVPLDEGIRRMAEWAGARGPRRTPSFGEIEIWRNLPDAWREDAARAG
jgi:UDP-glucose 4-epimerase